MTNLQTGPYRAETVFGMADTGRAHSSRGKSANSCNLVQILAGALQHEMQIPAQVAHVRARDLVRWMVQQIGGRSIYCPKRLETDRTARNAAIRQEFNGRNRDELCSRYEISLSSFYSIVGKRP